MTSDSVTPSAPAADSAPAPAPADQTDRLILTMAKDEAGWDERSQIVIVDDEMGALTREALAAAGAQRPVLVWNASHARSTELADEHAKALRSGRLRIAGLEGAPADLGELIASGTDAAGADEDDAPHVVLMRLPKALAALDHRAAQLARAVTGTARAQSMTIIAGGRVKHMTRSQNEVLERHFTDVYATRGLGKSRCLVAKGASTQAGRIAAGTAHGGTAHAGTAQDSAADAGAADLGTAAAAERDGAGYEAAASRRAITVQGASQTFELRGIGGVFGGASADAGSLLLLSALDEAVTSGALDDVRSAVDLGSGNGLLTAYLAAALPSAAILASDDDADAVASTRATLDASGLLREGIDITWDTSIARAAEASADLVVLNPPFHEGTAIDATLVQGLLDAAARVLRPGGELWMVHNSLLRYRRDVERRVGPVEQRGRDRRFTVLRAVRREESAPSAPAEIISSAHEDDAWE